MKCNMKKELRKGIKVEMEHAHLFPNGMKRMMAKKIARDHLMERCDYYTELAKLEKKLRK